MSFLKNAMATVLGVGGSKIDTILDNRQIKIGDNVTGIIKIYGGQVEQQINGIILSVKTKIERESNDKKKMEKTTIQKVPIAIGRSVLPNENLEVPFSFKLNENCPISTFKFNTWIDTNLDIAKAIDSKDGDPIEVLPSYEMQNILTALSELGFRSREIENIPSIRKINNMSFIQEFEFIATKAPFRGRLDELEIVFSRNMYGYDLYLEIDRRANSIVGLLAEKLNLDETKIRISIENRDLNNLNSIKEQLFNIIRTHC
ncbi:MAG: sporulation protein [Sarcina sp.]